MIDFYRGKKVLVAGAAGLIGHATVKKLLGLGAKVTATEYNRKLQISPCPTLRIIPCDLMVHEECIDALEGIDVCINLVAFVRGAEGQSDSKNHLNMVRNNLLTSMNMIDAAMRLETPHFGFVGSSTMYPDVGYPVVEDDAFRCDPPHTYRGIGWTKRYLEKIIEHYQTLGKTKFSRIRPTAIYGPHDAFNTNGHVIPQLIMKAHRGDDPFEIWGDGTQIRDFVYVDDAVEALLTAVALEKTGPYNVSTGKPTSVRELAETIVDIYGYRPEFRFDRSKPTMIPTRLLDNTITEFETKWKAKHNLRTGLEKTIDWYKKKYRKEA